LNRSPPNNNINTSRNDIILSPLNNSAIFRSGVAPIRNATNATSLYSLRFVRTYVRGVSFGLERVIFTIYLMIISE